MPLWPYGRIMHRMILLGLSMTLDARGTRLARYRGRHGRDHRSDKRFTADRPSVSVGAMIIMSGRESRESAVVELQGSHRLQIPPHRCRRKTRNAVQVLENIGRGERI